MHHYTEDPSLRFHPGSHELFSTEYMSEIQELARISRKPNFEALLQKFTPFQGVASPTDPPSGDFDSTIKRIARGSCVIDSNAMKKELFRDALAAAHVAACCHLLHGSTLTLPQLQGENLINLAQGFLDSCKNKPEEYRTRMVGKIHAMDTMRTMQMIRALGLLTRPTPECHQLGLASGDGTRDLLFAHLQPVVRIDMRGSQPVYNLLAEQQAAADTVIVDFDPAYGEHYENLKKHDTLKVHPYNMKAIDALGLIPDEVEHRRNLVTGFRIDHRMLPDVKAFLARLANCLDDAADLILTIGAGDTVADFEGRLDKMRELFAALEGAGLRPLLFKLHGSGSPAKQRQSLRLGNLRASSYQVLYCRLVRERLSAASP